MDLANSIQIIAILIECAVVVIAVLIATRNNRPYGWLIATTFALFALFDGIRIFFPNGFPRLYSLILFVACSSMLYAMWLMYTETRKSG
ncbi:hypothetical protein [Methanoregula sp.]|uniref:hypothetical protein n=1 Tax=Methanoregula sp. TaxID=2052170 RepID=UPI003FD6E039